MEINSTDTNKRNTIVQKSMGWSLFSEIAAKFVTPVTNMILARLLTPNDFGVLAVCNMLITFADIITDAGFGKYLVQHDFKDEKEKKEYANVAFWSNLFISIVLTSLIIFNRASIATLLGNSEYATVIAIASIQLVLTSISSIQTGLFRRTFEYKKLFIARVVVAAVPLAVAVPIAFLTRSYWALIIGNLSSAAINSLLLTGLSKWRPNLYYSFQKLRNMFSFSFWSLCEGLANWAIFWVDTFLVTQFYNEYYVGLYKNSANMVMSIMGMISASMSPVLLSTLSRVKDKKDTFYALFLSIQRIVLYLVLPMGIGLFCYRKIATYILFGSQWGEAQNIVGAWSLMMMLSVIFYSFPAEIFKSKGIPKYLFILQCIYLLIIIPTCVISLKMGFWEFVYFRCTAIIGEIVICFILLKIVIRINPLMLLTNMSRPLMGCISIIIIRFITYRMPSSNLLDFLYMVISGGLYLGVVYLFSANDIRKQVKFIQSIKLPE